MDIEYVDYMNNVNEKSINILDKGNVSIIDFSPRMVPKGRTPEFRIVQGARVSFGQELKSEEIDNKLLSYLIENGHTSQLNYVLLLLELKYQKLKQFKY